MRVTCDVDLLSVFCADVGSIATGRFGWAGHLADESEVSGSCINALCDQVARLLASGRRVALGFECPLFIPMAGAPAALTRARNGEGNRPWSAGAGCGSLATGLAQTAFVLSSVRSRVEHVPVFLQWDAFARSSSGLFLWEAFVSGSAKTTSHVGDAWAAVRAFVQALPNPDAANRVREPSVVSLIGAMLLRTGWDVPNSILSEPCLVIAAA